MSTPETLPGLLLRRAGEDGARVALREKEFGIWQELSWSEYRDRVRDFSLGLIDLGLEQGDRVAIIGDNRPEWVIAEIAAQAAGAIPIGVYQDSVADELRFLLESSGACVVVAEDQEQVDKVLDIIEHTPAIEHIVYHDEKGLNAYDDPRLRFFPEVEKLGRARHLDEPTRFESDVAGLDPDATALLCPTSGTTSRPKLAMLSHRNLLAMTTQIQAVDPVHLNDDYVSFLPLAWIGEQMISVPWALTVGFAVSFPESTDTVRQDLREIGPQTLVSPPRIWESLVSDVQVGIEDSSPLKRRVYEWSMSVGQEAAAARFRGESLSGGLRWKRQLAEILTFLPLKDQLGLRHVRRAYTGGAALGPDVFRFFHAMGVNLKQLYGQTEVSGISAVHRDGDVKFQTVGKPLPDTEVRIAEGGEVLSRSPAIFGGYYDDEDATAEALKDGWLHSGDAGYMDDEGHLVVIDRAKDVMTLADGTAFSPQFIENKLKFSPYVREAVVFGGDWPFVTAIIAIDFANAGTWAERRRLAYTTFTDLAQRSEIYDLISSHTEDVNTDLPDSARVRRFLLLHKEFDADDGELTRTRKVRRGFIAERYAELVQALYGEADTVAVESTISYQDGRTSTVRHDIRIAGTSVPSQTQDTS
jgi:long-chain acyl-CoA synthetase